MESDYTALVDNIVEDVKDSAAKAGSDAAVSAVEQVFGTKVPGTDIPVGPPKDKYAVSTAWSKAKEYKEPFDYTIVTINQTVLVQRLDMGDLLKLGIAEELDFMTKALMTNDKDISQNAQAAMTSAVMKAENFSNMERMINLVCNTGVLKPRLQLPPPEIEVNGVKKPGHKQPGQLYLDVIPFADRMELFAVIFDTEGLSTFRSEQDASVANVGDVQNVQLPAD